MSNNSYDYQRPPAPAARTSAWAIISLIAGIAAFTILPGLGTVFALIGGYVAKKEIRNGNGMVTGSGMATWGLVLGWISVALGLIAACVVVLMVTGVIGVGGLAACGPFSDMMNEFSGY